MERPTDISPKSQLGFHDSELSIVMQDTATIDSTMNGQPYTAGRHAATLRRMLWREHLGLLPAQSLDASDDPNAQPPGDAPNDSLEGKEYDWVADPLSDEVWDTWCQQASTNMEVFRDLFHADPDDSSMSSFPTSNLPCVASHVLILLIVKTFDDYKEFLPTKNPNHKEGHIFDHESWSAKDIRKQLDRIRGHLVWMPLQFLCNAEMAEKGLQVNQYTESIYT